MPNSTPMNQANLGRHFLIVGIKGDQFEHAWFCSGGDCRGDSKVARCKVIECWHGMSDLGAYRADGEPFALMAIPGDWNAGTFVPNPAGASKFELVTKDEYVEIEVDGQYQHTVGIDAELLNIFEVRLDFDLYEEEYGDEEELGAFWSFDHFVSSIKPGDPLWADVDSLRWDYINLHSSDAQVRRDRFMALVDASV